MKNLKTKVGVSLVALAFFATVGFASKSANTSIVWNTPDSRDPDVMKVVETIKQTEARGYETSNKRFVSFAYNKEPYEYLELKIYKLDKDGAVIHDNHVVIKDYNLDNLDSKDTVSYVKKSSHPFIYWEDCPEIIVFSKLSEKTQQEVKNEYNAIIKEAPKKLLKADEKKKQWRKQQEEREARELENKILNIIK